MTLAEQVRTLRNALAAAEVELNDLRCSLDRKIRAPYPDGTTSDQVNANTDVLPRIEFVRRGLLDVMAATEPLRFEPSKSFAEHPTLANANAWLKFKYIGRISKRDDEYRVRFNFGGGERGAEADYHTNDLADAYHTAIAVHRSTMATRR